MSSELVFAPLTSRALIAVGGPDWRDFLQNLLSQSVDDLAPGEARFGALLTPQGRLLYDLFVVGREDGCWLDVEASQRDALIQRLAMYRLRAKVEIAASELSVSCFYEPLPPAGRGRGGGAGSELAVLTPPPPTPSPQGGGVWTLDPRLRELGWRGYGVEAPDGAVMRDEAERVRFKLSLGVPGPADWGSDRTYPIEANFDLLNGIDFQKGCFVGQETTSRMKRRGQIKNRILPIVFEGPPPAFGAEVLAGDRRAGEALSGQAGRAFALVRLDRALGAELFVEGRPARAEVPGWMSAALGEEAA